MGTYLHFDCYSGISGDMILGALVDVGVPFPDLVASLKRLPVKGFQLKKRQVHRGAIHATKIDVLIGTGLRHPLSLRRIHQILASSRLPEKVKQQSRSVFDRLVQAEGKAHGVAPARVHFHEVGVLDSLVDIVGGLIGCDLLGVTRVTASPINVGAGTIKTAHGLLPVPGPAVSFLAKGIPVYSAGPAHELATPTGVALLRTLTSEFGPMPVITPTAVGYGAGDADPEGWPNVLRLFLSRTTDSKDRDEDRVVQIETNLDDLNPQAYEHVMAQLFACGALDVTLTPVIMKRGRPGIVLTCLTAPELVDPMLDVLFRETTSLGVRIHDVRRQILPRRFESVKVRGGTVRMKIGAVSAAMSKASPEYVDCKRVAERTGLPLKTIFEEAAQAYAASRTARRKK